MTGIVSPEVAELFNISPLSLPSFSSDDKYAYLKKQLPPWGRARYLCDVYLGYRTWAFSAVTFKWLNRDLLPRFYSEAGDAGDCQDFKHGETTNSMLSAHTVKMHTLALMFVVLSIGALLDPEAPSSRAEGNQYYVLSQHVADLAPFLRAPPCLNTIQLLVLMPQAQVLRGEHSAVAIQWTYLGLAGRLAQSVSCCLFMIYQLLIGSLRLDFVSACCPLRPMQLNLVA
jgi:hypothetical protein